MPRHLKTLIVEDSKDDARLLVRELARGGYDVACERVETAADMRTALGREAWDVIIADYRLPRFTGLEALGIVKERDLDVPFIIVSGAIGEETAVAAMRAGAHDYIMKDHLARLVPAVARELGEAEVRRERRRSEQRYRTVFDNAADALFIHDLGGHFLDVNPVACERMGYTREELLEMNVADIDERPEHVAERLALVRESGRAFFETTQVTKEGTVIPVEVNVRLIDFAQGPAVLSIARDITQRKRIAEQLRQAAKMEAVGHLAGGVAHDFNNLLTAILGYANVLKIEAAPETEAYTAAKTIERAAERAAALTEKLLGFARRDTHDIEPVNVHDLVGEVTTLLQRTLDKRIVLESDLGADSVIVEGDPGQLQQVLLNLAVNARDAMPDGGELTFATEQVTLDEMYCRISPDSRPGEYIVVAVRDTGCGIPKDVRERIFEPFFTTKEGGRGTGMGLSIAYGVVKRHGGFMQVYSEVGHGTIFRVYLPLALAAPGQAPPTRREEPVRGEGAILLVDDEEVVRSVTGSMLERLGYSVVTANDGVEAVAYYREHRDDVDLVLLDMIMPEMGGLECFETLREIDPSVKAVLSTGYGRDARAEQILRKGMAGFVPKPYSLHELSKAVANAMGITS